MLLTGIYSDTRCCSGRGSRWPIDKQTRSSNAHLRACTSRAMQVTAFKVEHLSYQRPACMHRRRTSDMQESMVSHMLRRLLCSHGSKGRGSPHQTDRHTTRARVAELS